MVSSSKWKSQDCKHLIDVLKFPSHYLCVSHDTKSLELQDLLKLKYFQHLELQQLRQLITQNSKWVEIKDEKVQLKLRN